MKCKNCSKECFAKARSTGSSLTNCVAVSVCCGAEIDYTDSTRFSKEKIINECICGYVHLSQDEPWQSFDIDKNEVPFFKYEIMTNKGSKDIIVCPKCGTMKVKIV